MVTNLFRNSQRILEKQHNSIMSAASIIQFATLLAALLGFIQTRLLISYFYDYNSGFLQGAALDVYYVAFRIPDLVFQLLVVGALSAAFIPIFSKYQHQDKEEAFKVANSMINIILVFFLVLAALIFIFAEPLNQMLTGKNFSPEQLALSVKFTRIMLLSQLFFAVSSFMTGIIQANHRFLIPALSPLAYNFGIIIGIIVLGPYLGIYGAAVGVLIGAFFHLALQIPLAIKLGYKYRPVIHIKHPGVTEMSTLMGPRTLALSIDQIETLAFTRLATNLDAGSLVILTLAQKLMRAPVRIFGVPIGQASLPFLSQESAKRDLPTFRTTFLNSFHQILYVTLPASALLVVLRIPLVRILYGAKEFPWSATLLTGKLVAILSLAIVAYATTQLTTRAFYALHNTRLPLISALISAFVSIGTSFALLNISNMGIVSIAIGAILGAIIQSLFLFCVLFKRLGGFDLQSLLIPILKIFIASSLTGVFLWIPMRLFDQILDTTRTLNLVFLTISATAIGAMVYLWLSKLLKVTQLDAYLKLFDKLGNWQKTLSSSDETLNPSNQNL